MMQKPGGILQGNSGIFYLGQTEDEFILTAGNFVRNSRIESFKERLDMINDLNDDELNEYFNKILLDQNAIDPQKTGLGFVDIRLKSNRKIAYDFTQINDDFSFFTIQTSVKLK